MDRNKKGGTRQIEEESQHEYLDELIKDFERQQTIQDVGAWLINDTRDPLPPKHVAVLNEWLETNNKLTIKQSRRGNPHSAIRNSFLYITRLHRDTGMSIEAACKLVVEKLRLSKDPLDLRRMYDRARTPETRFLSETVNATGAFSKGGAPLSKVQKAGRQYKKGKKVQKELKK
jgi:hypothetical protein